MRSRYVYVYIPILDFRGIHSLPVPSFLTTDVVAILCLKSSTLTLSLCNVIIVLFSKNMMD